MKTNTSQLDGYCLLLICTLTASLPPLSSYNFSSIILRMLGSDDSNLNISLSVLLLE